MGTSIDGLISGLDTTSLIDSLMQAAAQPQTVLRNQAAGQQTTIQALQSLNSKIAALATLATSTAKAGAGASTCSSEARAPRVCSGPAHSAASPPSCRRNWCRRLLASSAAAVVSLCHCASSAPIRSCSGSESAPARSPEPRGTSMITKIKRRIRRFIFVIMTAFSFRV